jgi:hypothetical protein
MALGDISDSDSEEDPDWPAADAPTEDDGQPTRVPTGAPKATQDAVAEEARRRKDYVPNYSMFLLPKWYIDKDVFLTAIQDPGVVDPKSGDKQLIHYPVMKAMASKMFHKMKAESFPNMPLNVSRVTPVIILAIMSKRDFVSVSAVNREFKQYSADKSSVYIIANNNQFYGYNQVLLEVHYFFHENKKKKEKDRSPSDAVRVAAIMLDPANLKAVTLMLSGTRQARAQSDQSVDPSLAWAMDAAAQFNDDLYEVPDCHHDIDPDDVDGIEPNGMAGNGGLARDAKWFLDTWKLYLKKKYKDAIRKWDTETGGGSHEPHQFSNFCNRDRWLVWVYMLDRASGFLLFHIAKGQPPEHIGCESGSEMFQSLLLEADGGGTNNNGGDNAIESSSNGEDEYGDTTPIRPLTLFTKRKRSAIETCRKNFQTHQGSVVELVEFQKKRHMERTHKDLYAQSIDAHDRLERFERSIAYLKPAEKKTLLKGARAEVKAIHKKMLAEAQSRVSTSVEGSGDSDDDEDNE